MEDEKVMKYPPHQQRVLDEHAALVDKITKLDAFIDTKIFAGLDSAEQHRLRWQLYVMLPYRDVLAARIAAF